jgi:hypothetical protein
MGRMIGPDLSSLRSACPHWRIWTSDTGWLYATRPGMSVIDPGGSLTVDAATTDGLELAIAAAESEYAKMVAAQQLLAPQRK